MELSENERITQCTYDNEPEAWMLGHSNLEYWRDEFEKFNSLCDELGLKRGRILDLGCGFGRDYRLFRDEEYKYVGLDFSDGLLEEAHRLNPGAQFVKANMRTLPFKKDSVSGFWAAASLLHIEKKNIRDTLLGIREILQFGAVGLIILKEGEVEGLSKDDKVGKYSVGGERFFAYYAVEEFTNILLSCGFLVLLCRQRKEKRKNGEDLTWLEFYVVKNRKN